MIRQDAEKLVHFVNDKPTMDALFYYTNLRIEALKEKLVSAPDMETVKYLQGAIEELKRVKNLRDEVNKPNG